MSVRKPRGSNKNLVLEKKAWFLCKFLSRALDEDTFENLRYHVSICKGVKTKVKLSEKGWSVGYKTSSLRHLGHKLPYEFFPLNFVTSIQQDSMFVNVLLCILRMDQLPELQYEIVAYKFPENTTVKKFQDVFQILTGNEQSQVLRAPGSTLTLVPGRSYHMGTLSPDRWGSRDRLGPDDSVIASEVRVNGTGQRDVSHTILESEGSWSGGSSLIDDSGTTVFRMDDGTVVAPSAGSTYGRQNNNITFNSVDSYDGLGTGRYRTTNHKVYSKPPSERGRTPDHRINRNRYQSTDSSYSRSRSLDPFGREGAMSPRNGYMASDRSEIMSVRSQSSYLLSPNFKKVYVPRGPQDRYLTGSVQNLGPRSYAGSETARRRW